MAGAVTVRMYNIGFGDAFLVSAPVAGRVWRMLVDCGVHTQGRSEHDIDDVVADIIATARDASGRPWLDVVVGTHRHRDHVLGFEDERWAEVEVGEVWLPWVEDPNDLEATRLREVHDAAAFALHQSFAAAADPAKAALALNSLTNERAMWTLRNGFAGTPTRRYVAADLEVAHEVVGLPGAGVRFLGPPRDPAAIRAMNPPKAQRWFGPTGDAESSGGAVFPGAFVLDAAMHAQLYPHLAVPPALIDRMLLEEDDAFAAATWLDRSVNNTSVIFLLQVGAARLLFPGDAQWGAWRGLLESATTRALLSQVTLYKISHHGSHNGTPTELAREVLSGSLTSLLSVKLIPRWSEVPKVELVDELAEQGRLMLRSADPAPEPARRHPAGLWVEYDAAI